MTDQGRFQGKILTKGGKYKNVNRATLKNGAGAARGTALHILCLKSLGCLNKTKQPLDRGLANIVS